MQQVRILNAKDLSHLTAIEAHNCMITALWTDDCHIITGGTHLVSYYDCFSSEIHADFTINVFFL